MAPNPPPIPIMGLEYNAQAQIAVSPRRIITVRIVAPVAIASETFLFPVDISSILPIIGMWGSKVRLWLVIVPIGPPIVTILAFIFIFRFFKFPSYRTVNQFLLYRHLKR